MTPEILAFLKEPQTLIITKANVKSLVHRRVHMDYVGVKLYDDKGGVAGELRIVGLLTAAAYNDPVASVPYIRRKAEYVIEKTDFTRGQLLRPGTRQRARKLPARRTLPDRPQAAARLRARHHGALGPATHSGAGAR